MFEKKNNSNFSVIAIKFYQFQSTSRALSYKMINSEIVFEFYVE